MVPACQKGWGVLAQVAECLLSMKNALGSIPSTENKQ
jgi:hypothetical protein